ncbi:MAG: flavodoxin family protein [Solirubrobacteraceae bacterium]
MSAIVVYESIYGNTREVAEAIAAGLGDARAVSVHEALSKVTKADLLVVGGPTHAHGLTSKRSRSVAAENAHGNLEPGATDELGLRDWLADLPRVANAQAAAFDTRANGSTLLTGAASHGIARRLRRHGYRLLETESFVVKGTEGPPADGELERAREWGGRLAKALAVSHGAVAS